MLDLQVGLVLLDRGGRPHGPRKSNPGGLYVNGRLEEDEERVSVRWHTLGFDAGGPLQLGRTKVGGAWGEYWAGALDDVWAFSGTLTQEQIQTLAGYTELPSGSPFWPEVPPSRRRSSGRR
ncbi:LamG-like jellyroll fold domain-containing protein [Nonomuraea sp. NPDC050783]|uniref:LamG-like jellyroll fold domain-containing protein n=1 Tax=Nonomuraea sp. NPDC050783 TaxID=3154634 RepID=UPI0034677D70